MNVHRILEGVYIFDVTPALLLDGRYVAHATISRDDDPHVEDLWPELDPFPTEAEAASAAHMAARAFVSSSGMHVAA